jgi:hypothetical protein
MSYTARRNQNQFNINLGNVDFLTPLFDVFDKNGSAITGFSITGIELDSTAFYDYVSNQNINQVGGARSLSVSINGVIKAVPVI